MVDEKTRRLGIAWVTWVGIRGAAEEMGVSEETIKEWCADVAPPSERDQKLNGNRGHQPQVDQQPHEAPAPEAKPDRRVKYTPEQKAAALVMIAEIGVTKTARQTGISIGSLNKWRQESIS